MDQHHFPSLDVRLSRYRIILLNFIICCEDQREFKKKIKSKGLYARVWLPPLTSYSPQSSYNL